MVKLAFLSSSGLSGEARGLSGSAQQALASVHGGWRLILPLGTRSLPNTQLLIRNPSVPLMDGEAGLAEGWFSRMAVSARCRKSSGCFAVTGRLWTGATPLDASVSVAAVGLFQLRLPRSAMVCLRRSACAFRCSAWQSGFNNHAGSKNSRPS